MGGGKDENEKEIESLGQDEKVEKKKVMDSGDMLKSFRKLTWYLVLFSLF